MSRQLTLIVGLGNPGDRYARTRHNAGAWFVDALARQLGTELRHEAKFSGASCRAELDGHAVWLLKPATYMNHSGQSVGAFAGFYRIAPESILVAHDDLDLSPGTVRIKSGGGHGGHNGLRDITGALGGNGFLRLRLGIGHPGHRDDVTDYVLHTPSAADRTAIDAAIQAALEIIPVLLNGELEKVMNSLHARSGG